MPKFLRRMSVVLALLCAWAFVGRNHVPLPLMMGEAEAGPTRTDARGEKPTHELSSLRIFTKVILYVRDNYVDPARIKPKEMVIAALEYVEKTTPDVLVDGDAESGKLKLNVNGKVKDFDISHLDSMWKMSFMLKDVFDFIAKNMRPVEDTRDIEYAAVNGMLSTLDPHSVLLRPELFREMRLSTKGEFGGLGFVIQMKEGNLTVVKVLPKTPAHRAGIKKDDLIRKIGEESTVNMDLNEAVSKLRGPEDSPVTITVERKGWEKPQNMKLLRARISIESVQSKLLAGNVGYIRLKNFQGNTTKDLREALKSLGAQAQASGGLKGVVLDLRGNPGGLLDQAIHVSDLFISQGTIVSTVGQMERKREETRAHADADDDKYPMAVLINAGSASASEIVAGALKNLNRAVVIGRQSFGKGSVQVLYDFPDDSALKLTIAKYLTPGDISIQEVGIVPDINLVPTRVTQDRVDVFAPRKSMGEADLDKHFGNSNSEPVATKREDVLDREKPLDTLRYLKEDATLKDASAKAQLKEEGRDPKLAGHPRGPAPAPKHGDRDPTLDVDMSGIDDVLDDQLDAESQDEVKEDFEVLFARDFVLRAPSSDRQQMLKLAKPLVDEKRREEEERINAAISALGIDWSKGETPKSVRLAAELKPGPEKKILAGDLLPLEVVVENKGTQPVHRLRGWAESENPFLDRREFLFGTLKPGEKRSWTVPVRLPKDLTSRRDDVKIHLFDDSGELKGQSVVSELSFLELPRPSFAFNYQVLDGCESCNGDGQIQRGETVEILLDVTNTGTGRALGAFSSIKNGADSNIFIDKGRFKLGELAPGETRTARFQLQVKPGYTGADFPLKLAIVDEPLEEFTSEKLVIPVADQGLGVNASKHVVAAREKARLFDTPQDQGRAIATLPKGGALRVLGESGGFYKVAFEGNEKKPVCQKERNEDGAEELVCQPAPTGLDRFAFVRQSEVKPTRTTRAPAIKDVSYLAFRDPPHIQLNVDPAQGGLVADGERFTLTGTVESAQGLLDMYVLVNDQKVFFKGVDGQGEAGKVQFTADFPLKDGNNTVMVVARESPDFAARKTVVIRRRSAALAAQLQPAAQKTANP